MHRQKEVSMRRSQREGLAYHEAGHAVIAYAYAARNIKKISIAPKRVHHNGSWIETGGRCVFGPGTHCNVLQLGATAAAGPEAERRYWGGRLRGCNIVSWKHDHEQVRRLVESLKGDAGREYWEHLIRKLTQCYVSDYWSIIQTVAAELVAHETVGPEINEIIRRAIPGCLKRLARKDSGRRKKEK
jgi:hypothetical protein